MSHGPLGLVGAWAVEAGANKNTGASMTRTRRKRRTRRRGGMSGILRPEPAAAGSRLAPAAEGGSHEVAPSLGWCVVSPLDLAAINERRARTRRCHRQVHGLRHGERPDRFTGVDARRH